MKLPGWVLPVIATLISAFVIGGVKVYGDVASIKSTNELRRDQMIEASASTIRQIDELKAMIKENDKDNKLEHERILKTLERMARRERP